MPARHSICHVPAMAWLARPCNSGPLTPPDLPGNDPANTNGQAKVRTSRKGYDFKTVTVMSKLPVPIIRCAQQLPRAAQAATVSSTEPPSTLIVRLAT
jgi:hypothetical protein